MIQYFYVVLYQQRLWLSSIIITNFRCQWKPLDRWRSLIQVCVCVCTNINSHRKPKDKSSSIKWTKADFPMAISLIIKNKVLYKIQPKNIKSKRKKDIEIGFSGFEEQRKTLHRKRSLQGRLTTSAYIPPFTQCE